MKYRIVETVLSVWFLGVAASVLNSPLFDNLAAPIALGLFYFTIAFAIIRRLQWVRYLVYINLAGSVILVVVVTYFTGLDSLGRLLIALVIPLLAAFYCRHRFNQQANAVALKREISLYFLGLSGFIAIALLMSFLSEPTVKTLSAPVQIQQ